MPEDVKHHCWCQRFLLGLLRSILVISLLGLPSACELETFLSDFGLSVTTASMVVLGLLGILIVIIAYGRAFANEFRLANSPDAIESSLGISETESLAKFGIALGGVC